MKKGKLIVIDGTDGSGKATQVELLRRRLVKEGYDVRTVDFPEYYKNFFGGFIGECLANKQYNFLKVHPKIASVLYAADRFESKEKMETWFKKGYVVLANRYVSANQIHQGGKIKNIEQRKDFLRWLDDMEYRVFGIPRPDTVVYLDLPISITRKLMKERDSKNDRAYLKKKKDVHEADVDFLKNSRNTALWLADELPYFRKIECNVKNELLSREVIHEKVYKEIKKILK